MFILIAACLTFLAVFILLWPIRKIASLLKMLLSISIPVLVCTYLWFNNFFELPPTFKQDNQKLSEQIKNLEHRLMSQPFDINNLIILNELYLESGALDHSLDFLKTEITKHPKNALLQLKLAESIVYSDDGIVTEDTKVIFNHLKKSRDLETQKISEFYLGLYKAQQGDLYDALKIWQRLIKTSHADDRWLMLVVPAVRKISLDLNLDPVKQIPRPKPPRY